MKRLYALLLSICLLVVFSVPVAAAAKVNEKAPSVPNERIINILKKNNIDFQMVDGNVKLNDTSPKSIAEVNKLLSSQSQINNMAIAATSYPTAYVHMSTYDIYTSKNFKQQQKPLCQQPLLSGQNLVDYQIHIKFL
ncbi:hypothetical protein [Aneurinibacillus tyrosinisolvens]|uniref:hypothetical protein n=1 Tax=Aneurinibacillus tyrosinisolvens TaxID=1443435 RepID=UPI000AF96673|nr:hypothetical protein [Aneurinibacillus tyrosinisolvens]